VTVPLQRGVVWAGGASLLVAGALALGEVARAEDQVLHFPSRTELVVLSAIAVDRHGRPVTNMRQDEFAVSEDGRPQQIAHFSQGREAGARILFLIDASGSMGTVPKVASPYMVARQLLAMLEPGDQVALAGFDHKYWGVVGFTNDRQTILDHFRELEPFGSTALHDALDHAASDLASHGEGRRAVVVITDGVDTASRQKAEDVIIRSRALDVPIYAVSVVSPLDDPTSDQFAGQKQAAAQVGHEVLIRYAEMSGGAAFVVSDFAGLKLAADTIVGELKHQYRLGYDPPPGPSRFRRVEVTTRRKGVSVKTRSGYVPQS